MQTRRLFLPRCDIFLRSFGVSGDDSVSRYATAAFIHIFELARGLCIRGSECAPRFFSSWSLTPFSPSHIYRGWSTVLLNLPDFSFANDCLHDFTNMQFRQLTCTSVLLACAIAVFAAPAPVRMIERGVDQDVEVRSWGPSNAHDVVDTYRAAVLEARTPQRSRARPAARPAAAPRPNVAPAPVAPAPRPNTLPAQRPNTPPAQRPNTPPPAARPNTPAPKLTTTSASSGTQPTQKPAGDQCGAKSNGKSKRAFSTTCDTNSLTLGRVTRPITKVADQGNSAITYRVDGGWPDPSTGSLVTAYAKTGPRPGSTFTEEAMWLQKTGQLLAEGRYDGNNFIVFRGVTGKTELVGTTFFRDQLSAVAMGETDRTRCEALLRPKLALIVQEVKAYVDRYGILHTDIQPGNILWDSTATRPTLIDWGRARDVGVGQWSAQLEASVTQQAEFSHLRGALKLCGIPQ
ncbi:hypothetical protein BDN71DRAFT_864797 [Pleurotus eryngii]|uniref:Aminoglycoside phosphotransferase domain-containing protein n=1 Tax=Pleurotus eryngii TaxID=5323 RepID=A0A9P5ZYJ5_PLEER|nr:hypothetical protein BDN71DRAFT_864797 [Pleurotus eryngii]